MKINGNKKIIILLFLIMILTTSIYFAYKKISYKKPIAAKLVMEIPGEPKERFYEG